MISEQEIFVDRNAIVDIIKELLRSKGLRFDPYGFPDFTVSRFQAYKPTIVYL
jgi:hypothetical protein